jgi:two-component sensor histidine kinase
MSKKMETSYGSPRKKNHGMKSQFIKYSLFIYLITLSGISLYGQEIIDLKRAQPYLKVFVDTDNFGPSYLDVLEEAYPKIEVDSIKFSVLNDLAYYWHTRDLNKALDFVRIGLDLTRQNENKLWEGRFQITEGAILLRMERLDTAYVILQEAKAKVHKKDLALLNTQLGYVFERKGDLVRAADYALESKRLGEELNDAKAKAVAYSDLANLFWKNSKFEQGLEYGLKSLEFFEQRRINDMDYDFALYVVGNNLLELQKYDEALTYYNHSIAMGERYGFYNNLSDTYISLVDLYALLNQYQAAERAGSQAIKYASILNNNFLLMRCWLSIGKLQLFQGKYITAIESLQKSIDIAGPEFGDHYYLSEAYKRLGKARVGNHDYKGATEAFIVYDSLKNKVFTEAAGQRISLLQTEFDIAEKESTIQGMEDQLKKQSSQKTLITIIAGLLLLLLLVLYVTYQKDKGKNILLERQNSEKEFLLKEIHHRVKNNLGIVSSLLDLQAAKMKDIHAIEAIEESRNRVYSMSMIHQKLYQGKNLSSIEMRDYLINLSKHILDSYGAEKFIEFEYELDELELDVDDAIPLGLIVNELLTNSFKHAFPNRTKGKIKIVFQKTQNKFILLEIEDNGKGLSDDAVNNEMSSGFGTQLIDLLVQQLDGSIMTFNGKGTRVRMEFEMSSKGVQFHI